MEGPRAPHQDEFPRVLEFLNNELRPQYEWSLDVEYPTALSMSNISNIRIIKSQEKVLSHAVIRPLIVKSPNAIWKVGAIGSVVTHPEHRSQGLSTTILESCLAEAKKQDCDIAILWTNLYDFYRKLDFELAGSEISFVINKTLKIQNPSQLKFITGNQVSAEAILKVYTQHSVNTVRTAEEIRKYLAIPKTQTYTAWDSTGQLVAYAVEGKGADLTGYIHEWGGSVSGLMALFDYIRDTKAGKDYTVIIPGHSVNLQQALLNNGIVPTEGFLGMIKILNKEAVFNKITKAARNIGMTDFQIHSFDHSIQFQFGEQVITARSPRDLVQLIFGPTPQVPGLNQDLQNKMNRLFPMNLWLWGWDSI